MAKKVAKKTNKKVAAKPAQKGKAVKKGKKRSSAMGVRITFLLLLFFLASLLYLPTTIVFFFGMMPTWALYATDTGKSKMKTLAVGLLNFSGCSYVLMQLWTNSHTLDYAMNLMLKPESLIVMYVSAGAGYLIQSTISKVVASIVLEQTKSKAARIAKKQELLEQRWGYEVSGKVALDAYGFPIEPTAKKEGKPS